MWMLVMRRMISGILWNQSHGFGQACRFRDLAWKHLWQLDFVMLLVAEKAYEETVSMGSAPCTVPQGCSISLFCARVRYSQGSHETVEIMS
jgi:hypothetical protein